jgi:hypothetical protein
VILDFKERSERIKARAYEYRMGQASEAVTRARLFALKLRGEELNQVIRDNAPLRPYDSEEDRYNASLEWLRNYLGGLR